MTTKAIAIFAAAIPLLLGGCGAQPKPGNEKAEINISEQAAVVQQERIRKAVAILAMRDKQNSAELISIGRLTEKIPMLESSMDRMKMAASDTQSRVSIIGEEVAELRTQVALLSDRLKTTADALEKLAQKKPENEEKAAQAQAPAPKTAKAKSECMVVKRYKNKKRDSYTIVQECTIRKAEAKAPGETKAKEITKKTERPHVDLEQNASNVSVGQVTPSVVIEALPRGKAAHVDGPGRKIIAKAVKIKDFVESPGEIRITKDEVFARSSRSLSKTAKVEKIQKGSTVKIKGESKKWFFLENGLFVSKAGAERIKQ